MTFADPGIRIGTREFRSRLFVGTGKYASVEQTEQALVASGAEVVTVALRRVDLKERGAGSLMGLLASGRWTVLPNTAGCYTADDAVRTLRLARELGIAEMVKLEVIGDAKTLYPDNEQTLEAAKVLVKEGFTVLPYCIDDPIICRKLEDAGCAAVAMELGCDGVLMNTAIAHAKDPVLMASAMRDAVRAGRTARLAGRMAKARYANASSPTAGLIE